MTAPAAPRLVGVDELRRAWLAVQAGEFRLQQTTRRRSARPDAEVSGSSWTPVAVERVVPVVGSAGSCGATTVALALATAVDGPARVVECAPVSATGLAAASTAELGADQCGWTRGSRDQVFLDRAHTQRVRPTEVPLPSPVTGSMVTVVDVAQPVDQLLAGDSVAEPPAHPRTAPGGGGGGSACLACVVVGVVPGPARREADRHQPAGAAVAAVAPRGDPRHWPADRGTACRRRAVSWRSPRTGCSPSAGSPPHPCPPPFLAAATSLLHLTEGTSHD